MINYREHPALNHSKLKDMDKTPLYVYEKYIKKSFIEDQTDAMKIGTAFENIVFYPDNHKVIYLPENIDRRTKLGKESYAEFITTYANHIIIDRLDYNILHKMQQNLYKKNRWKDIDVKNCLFQQPIYFKYQDTDCKAELDIINVEKRIIWDLKSTSNIDVWSFSSSIKKFSYHTQAAFYIKAAQAQYGGTNWTYKLIACDKYAPYDCKFYPLPMEYIIAGMQKNEKRLTLYEQCMMFNDWPGEPDEDTELPVYDWVIK